MGGSRLQNKISVDAENIYKCFKAWQEYHADLKVAESRDLVGLVDLRWADVALAHVRVASRIYASGRLVPIDFANCQPVSNAAYYRGHDNSFYLVANADLEPGDEIL